jgi:branched-chain amino acid transport system substrate-binding protein
MDDYKKFNDDFYTAQVYHAYSLLSGAMAKAKSTDPAKVAVAMEGCRIQEPQRRGRRCARPTTNCSRRSTSPAVAEGRRQALRLQRGKHGLQLPPIKTYEPYVSSTPTSCQMKRPAC